MPGTAKSFSLVTAIASGRSRCAADIGRGPGAGAILQAYVHDFGGDFLFPRRIHAHDEIVHGDAGEAVFVGPAVFQDIGEGTPGVYQVHQKIPEMPLVPGAAVVNKAGERIAGYRVCPARNSAIAHFHEGFQQHPGDPPVERHPPGKALRRVRQVVKFGEDAEAVSNADENSFLDGMLQFTYLHGRTLAAFICLLLRTTATIESAECQLLFGYRPLGAERLVASVEREAESLR
jgi:hypothetical protein